MKHIAASFYLAASLHLAAQGSGEALLSKVITHPGSYSQVCDVMTAPSDLPYRAYQITDFSGASFSKANQALVQSKRTPVVAAIRERLKGIDLTKEGKTPSEDPKPEENNDGEAYGCDPGTLNPLILNLIVDLQAIETLPELLALEAKLVAGIAQAKDRASAPVPRVTGWFVAEENAYNKNASEAQRDRRSQLFNARMAQRDLVMVMQLLMRQKKYEPALKNRLEMAYVKGLKKQAADNGWAGFKPDEILPKEIHYTEIERDPVSQIVRSKYAYVAVPYTRESRDEVRAAASRWIKENP